MKYIKLFESIDKDFLTFLKACLSGNLWAVRELINKVAPIIGNNTAMKISVEKNHVEIVKILLEDGRFDPSFDNNYAMGDAINQGNVEIVKLLLKDGRVDPSDQNNYALWSAVNWGHIDIVKLLLKDKRVDPSDNGNIFIEVAEEKGHNNIVYLLLNHPKVYDKLSDEEIKKYSKGKPLAIDAIKNLNEHVSSPMAFLRNMGYEIKTSLGHGQQGSVYKTKDNKAIKFIDKEMLDHPIDTKVLDKIIGKKFEYLGEIYSYKDLSKYLIIEMEYINGGNEMFDYQMYIDEQIDFASEFYLLLSHNDYDLEKTTKTLIDEYMSEEDKDEDDFIIDKEDAKIFTNYYKDIYNGIKEASKYDLNVDIVDDNIVYDEKEKRYKIIDYL